MRKSDEETCFVQAKSKSSKRISFLRSVRRKGPKNKVDMGITANVIQAARIGNAANRPKMIDHSVFTPGAGGGTTKLSLTPERQESLSQAPSRSGSIRSGTVPPKLYTPGFHPIHEESQASPATTPRPPAPTPSPRKGEFMGCVASVECCRLSSS
jgi:hypothetical protein